MDDILEELMKYNPDLKSTIPERDNDSFYMDEPQDNDEEY